MFHDSMHEQGTEREGGMAAGPRHASRTYEAERNRSEASSWDIMHSLEDEKVKIGTE